MKFTVVMDQPEKEDIPHGYVEAIHKECEIPFELYQQVYYCHKRHKKWEVLDTTVTSIWANRDTGVKLANGWSVAESEYYRLFANVNDAIDWCVKNNQRDKVRVRKAWEL